MAGYYQSYSYVQDHRRFTVYINQGEMDQIEKWVLMKDNIETGGDLFGLWVDQHTAVVQFVLGPGEGCRRTSVSFFQDVHYLEKAGKYLTKHHGLCNIGQWHSHHRMSLRHPSGGDENTVWRNMPQLGLNRYIVFIATIEGGYHAGSTANVNCFLFEIDNKGYPLPVLQGRFIEPSLHGNSPFRLNESIQRETEKGAESINKINFFKKKERKARDNLSKKGGKVEDKKDNDHAPTKKPKLDGEETGGGLKLEGIVSKSTHASTAISSTSYVKENVHENTIGGEIFTCDQKVADDGEQDGKRGEVEGRKSDQEAVDDGMAQDDAGMTDNTKKDRDESSKISSEGRGDSSARPDEEQMEEDATLENAELCGDEKPSEQVENKGMSSANGQGIVGGEQNEEQAKEGEGQGQQSKEKDNGMPQDDEPDQGVRALEERPENSLEQRRESSTSPNEAHIVKENEKVTPESDDLCRDENPKEEVETDAMSSANSQEIVAGEQDEKKVKEGEERGQQTEAKDDRMLQEDAGKLVDGITVMEESSDSALEKQSKNSASPNEARTGEQKDSAGTPESDKLRGDEQPMEQVENVGMSSANGQTIVGSEQNEVQAKNGGELGQQTKTKETQDMEEPSDDAPEKNSESSASPHGQQIVGEKKEVIPGEDQVHGDEEPKEQAENEGMSSANGEEIVDGEQLAEQSKEGEGRGEQTEKEDKRAAQGDAAITADNAAEQSTYSPKGEDETEQMTADSEELRHDDQKSDRNQSENGQMMNLPEGHDKNKASPLEEQDGENVDLGMQENQNLDQVMDIDSKNDGERTERISPQAEDIASDHKDEDKAEENRSEIEAEKRNVLQEPVRFFGTDKGDQDKEGHQGYPGINDDQEADGDGGSVEQDMNFAQIDNGLQEEKEDDRKAAEVEDEGAQGVQGESNNQDGCDTSSGFSIPGENKHVELQEKQNNGEELAIKGAKRITSVTAETKSHENENIKVTAKNKEKEESVGDEEKGINTGENSSQVSEKNNKIEEDGEDIEELSRKRSDNLRKCGDKYETSKVESSSQDEGEPTKVYRNTGSGDPSRKVTIFDRLPPDASITVAEKLENQLEAAVREETGEEEKRQEEEEYIKKQNQDTVNETVKEMREREGDEEKREEVGIKEDREDKEEGNTEEVNGDEVKIGEGNGETNEEAENQCQGEEKKREVKGRKRGKKEINLAKAKERRAERMMTKGQRREHKKKKADNQEIEKTDGNEEDAEDIEAGKALKRSNASECLIEDEEKEMGKKKRKNEEKAAKQEEGKKKIAEDGKRGVSNFFRKNKKNKENKKSDKEEEKRKGDQKEEEEKLLTKTKTGKKKEKKLKEKPKKGKDMEDAQDVEAETEEISGCGPCTII